MNPYLELRLLRYAIAIAEELHFARAAERLHLSAPSLSKQIKQLEAVLGYELFERKTREVLLTPAGSAFVIEARQALVHAERAVECGEAASRGDTGVLSVGYTPWLDPSFLTAARSAFARLTSNTQMTFHSSSTIDQIDLLLKGSLQAGIVLLPVEAEGLRVHCVWREPLSLALADDHRLVGRQVVSFQDLAEEPMIWFARTINPALHDHLLRCCRKLGFMPTVAHEITSVSESLDLVAANVGVSFVKGSTAAGLSRKGVVFRELAAPGLAIDIGIAYRGDSRSQALKAFVRLLREQSSFVEP